MGSHLCIILIHQSFVSKMHDYAICVVNVKQGCMKALDMTYTKCNIRWLNLIKQSLNRHMK